jgi:hypothetical protein
LITIQTSPYSPTGFSLNPEAFKDPKWA